MSSEQLRTEAVVVAQASRLDAAAAPQLRESIEGLLLQGYCRLAVDLSGVTYLSSSGLRVLLSGLKKARAAGGDLVLCSLRGNVLGMIQTMGFDRLFRLYTTREQALQALRSAPAAASEGSDGPARG